MADDREKKITIGKEGEKYRKRKILNKKVFKIDDKIFFYQIFLQIKKKKILKEKNLFS